MRTHLFLCSLATLLLASFSAEAALSKYAIRGTNLLTYDASSPRTDILTGDTQDPSGTAVIDNDGGSGFPILVKWVNVTGGGPNAGTTTNLPSLSGFIWVKQKSLGGPLTSPNTGTGDVDSEIDWGFVSPWTVTGGSFCHSVPSNICDLATRQDSETVPPPIDSTKYDVGSWFFHGTGFRTDPRIARTAGTGSGGGTGNGQGNQQVIVRGVKRQDGTVPALPLIGIAAVGVSVLAMGAASLRRKH